MTSKIKAVKAWAVIDRRDNKIDLDYIFKNGRVGWSDTFMQIPVLITPLNPLKPKSNKKAKK